MLKILLISLFALNLCAALPQRDTTLSFELLGRAGVYSFNFDKLISDQIALGGGFSHYTASAKNSSESISLLILPLFANYYFSPTSHRAFATAGADIISANGTLSDTSTFTSSGVVAVIGGGYEYRGDNGFLFRAAPYIITGKNLTFWAGFSFGYAY